ncbi:MAG: DUF5615 family PIN-like protein, partial [Chloroflexota bacterium]
MKFLTDENFEGAIFRGLLRRKPDIDLVRVQDVGLMEADGPEILAWAAQEGRILLTHDRRTMPRYAYERMADSKSITSMIVIKAAISVGQAIEEILLIEAISTPEEWV